MRASEPDARSEWFLRGSDGREYVVPFEAGRRLTVGRDLTSDVALLDGGISRHHATLEREGTDIWLEDLHSQNGSYVNLERVQRCRVEEGDIVTFGRLHLTLVRRALPRERGADLLRPLSGTALAGLLRITRRLTIARDPRAILSRALEAVADGVPHERGAVLLRGPEGSSGRLAACRPAGGFPPLSPAEMSSFEVALDIGRVQVLRAGPTRSDGEPPRGPAVLVPIRTRSGPLGALYLERGGDQPPFGAPEVDWLSAFSWMTEGIFESALRLDGLLAREAEDIEDAVSMTGLSSRGPREGRSPVTDLGAALGELAAQIGRVGREVEDRDPTDEAVDHLRRLTLCADALRALWVPSPAGPEVVDVDAQLRQAARACGIGDSDWRLESREPLRILAPARRLEIALSLLVRTAWSGASTDPGSLRIEVRREAPWLHLLFSRSEEGVPPSPPDEDESLALDLARRLVETGLRGRIVGSAPEGEIELQLPLSARALDETAVF